jgi:hypothetical protein
MPLSLMRQAPVTSKFSSASPIGSIIRWHDMHAGFLRCCSIRSRTVRMRPPSDSGVSSSAGMLGGGAGGGVPSSTSITHLPRSTGEVRLASEVCTSIEPWPSRPRRVRSG